jgi:hypothetical protein
MNKRRNRPWEQNRPRRPSARGLWSRRQLVHFMRLVVAKAEIFFRRPLKGWTGRVCADRFCRDLPVRPAHRAIFDRYLRPRFESPLPILKRGEPIASPTAMAIVTPTADLSAMARSGSYPSLRSTRFPFRSRLCSVIMYVWREHLVTPVRCRPDTNFQARDLPAVPRGPRFDTRVPEFDRYCHSSLSLFSDNRCQPRKTAAIRFTADPRASKQAQRIRVPRR